MQGSPGRFVFLRVLIIHAGRCVLAHGFTESGFANFGGVCTFTGTFVCVFVGTLVADAFVVTLAGTCVSAIAGTLMAQKAREAKVRTILLVFDIELSLMFAFVAIQGCHFVQGYVNDKPNLNKDCKKISGPVKKHFQRTSLFSRQGPHSANTPVSNQTMVLLEKTMPRHLKPSFLQ